MLTYRLKGKLWLYDSWLPKRQAQEIRSIMADVGPGRRGGGSLRVKVAIGKTSWRTSIFPEKRSGSYLLPVKADVRKAEGLVAGRTVAFTPEVEG